MALMEQETPGYDPVGAARDAAWAAMPAICEKASVDAPRVGRRVRVVRGKKSVGVVGVVVWHGADRFQSTRYGTAFSDALRASRGREGYRVGIRSDSGGPTVFVRADYVELV